MKVVGVIGAGAAGLCATRHILAHKLVPVVWEKAPVVGGTWVYTPKTGTDHYGLPIHSSMYKSLKTNLPKEVMGFPDFPFASGFESFIHHGEVLKYLENYASHYNLLPHIKFGQHVEVVKPVDGGWSVTVRDLATDSSSTTICQALFVCVGHSSVPRMPHLKDIDKFQGCQMHSHDYREPSPFTGQKVVVLGAASSGTDISLELAKVAESVLLSHNLPDGLKSKLPSNIHEVPGIVSATETGFIFGDGSSAEADAIVYCTGYEYTYPFLSEECGITVKNNIVKPLYKHVINATHPSMAFIGIPFQVCPFPLFDFQIQYFLKSITGELTLPTKADMVAQITSAFEAHCSTGLPARHFHKLGLHQWQYNDDLAATASVPLLPKSVSELYEYVSDKRKHNLMQYKMQNFRITGPDTFEIVQ